MADSTNTGDKSKQERWARMAQEGEFQFHVTNEWRRSERFVTDTVQLFRFFGFGPDDFKGCVVLDFGAGPRLRSKFFKDAKIIALEPLAGRFLAEIDWCDLRDAWRVYSEPAEKMIPELEGQVDFVMCINVLDHTYDPLQVLLNARRYLKVSGRMLLSVDLHSKADEMYPEHFDRQGLKALVEKAGFNIQWSYLGLPNSDAYGHGKAYTLMLTPAGSVQEGRGDFLFVCSNGNHVKIFAPVASQLRENSQSVRFLSLDPYYGQGAGKELSKLDFVWTEIPTLLGAGDWFERSGQARRPLAFEAVQTVEAMFASKTPVCLVVANDMGTLEQFFLRTAERYGTRTVFIAETVFIAKGAYCAIPMSHGQTGKRMMVTDGGCELLCMWGEGVSKQLKEKGTSGRIVVTGNPRYDSLAGYQSRSSLDQPPTVVLAGQCYAKYGIKSDDEEYAIYERLLRLLAKRDHIHIIFKLHPQQDPTRYLPLGAELGDRVEVLQGGDSLTLLKRADVFITIDSTTGIEAIMMGVPTMMLLYLRGNETLPVFDGTPFIVKSEEAFLRALNAPDFPANLRIEPEIHSSFIRKTVLALDGKATARVVEAIRELMRPCDIPVQTPRLSVLMLLRTSRVNPLAAVRSVLRQSALPLEVVVVDQTLDGATGRCLGSKVTDGRLRVLYEPQTTSAAALNKGLSVCRGDVVARLEPACIALPGWAERLNAAVGTGVGCGFAVSWYILCDDFGNFRKIWTPPPNVKALWQDRNLLPAPVYAYRREFALAKGGYSETPDLDCDFALMGVLQDSGKSTVVPAPLYAVMKVDTPSTKPTRVLRGSLEQHCATNELDISVLLCSYNRADTLKRCLEALEKQTLSRDRFEVICVNDGSTDHTSEVMKAALKRLPGSYHEHAKNQGLAAARNTAIRAARGRLVVFINDDTFPEPDFLEQHIQAHKGHPNEQTAIFGHIGFAREHAERILSQVLHQHNMLFPLVGTREEVPYDFNYFVTANLSVARQAFVSEDIWFDETFRRYGCEDIEVGYRLWKRGYRVYYCPQAKVIHDHRLTVHDYQRRTVDNSSNLVQFVDKHPELVPCYLGVPQLTEPVLAQWRQLVKQEAPVIKKMVDRIAAAEDATPEALAGPNAKPSDAMKLVKQTAVLLGHISRHIKRQTILQILDDSPDVRYRLVNSTSSQPQSKTIIERSPLVSVIIPCYNYGCYLPEAVESVLNQTYQNFEIIIVNDGSPDDTKEVAEKLIAEHPQHQIRLINQANSGQPAIARNNGIAEAKGEYILPLDADDKLAPQAIESYIRAVEDYPEQPIVVFGWLQYFGVEENLWKTHPFSPDRLLRRTLLPYCSMFHRSVWEFQNGYSANVPGYEDWDFWVGAAKMGAKFINVPLVTAFYRETDASSLVDSARKRHEWLVAGIISNHSDIYEDEEVIWATDYLGRFPEAPEERQIHGQNDKFPKAAAVLVVSYQELYTPEEVAWAKQFLNKKPFKILKGIKPGPVKVDASCESESATDLDYFIKARQEFDKGNFETAVEYMRKYRLMMDYSRFPRILNKSGRSDDIKVSVIIVTYNRTQDLTGCLESLAKQDCADFETVVVDNGENDFEVFKQYVDQYVKCPINFVLSEGRNIGACCAKGKIIAFLDDDALVPSNYISSIKAAFERYDIFGLRGRAYPKSNPDANNDINVYDLGDKPFPSYCNQEGNSAWLLEVYKSMDGMDPLLFGHEGSDLTFRIIKEYKQPNKIIYWPHAIIYHDYGTADKLRLKKRIHQRNANYLKYKHNTDIFVNRTDIEKYPLPLKQTQVLPDKASSTPEGSIFQPTRCARHPVKPSELPKVKYPNTVSAASTSHLHPRVSIVISCYNSEKFLPECLDSIRNQTMNDWELFLLDDASTDGTRSIIEKYSRTDERIRPYYFQDNKGPYVRRNFAIERANSDFIVIQDADDIMCPTKLETLYNEITKNERLGVVGSFYQMFLDEFKGLEYTDRIELPIMHDEIMERYCSTRYVCWHGSAIIRKTMFEAIGLYDEHPYGSDRLWLAKMAEYARWSNDVRLKNVPEYLTLKREHPLSQQGLLPTLDPRSRRTRFQVYWEYKLVKIREKLQKEPATDLAAELRSCDCSDYIERFGYMFEQWESEPLDDEHLHGFISKGIREFYTAKYVSCIITLNSVERMVSDVAKEFWNYDLLWGLANFALDRKEQCEFHIKREIKQHQNSKAEQFLNKYLNETDGANELTAGKREVIIERVIFGSDDKKLCVAGEADDTIVRRTYNLREAAQPRLSIGIVASENKMELLETLDALNNQSDNRFETIVINNVPGAFEAQHVADKPAYGLSVIELAQKTSTILAKNIAISHAQGDYVAFLAEDAVPNRDFVRNIINHFENSNVSGLRGKILPKSGSYKPEYYVPGEKAVCTGCDANEICAFRRDILVEVGGFKEKLYGNESIELSYRLYRACQKDIESVMYFPDVIVYHGHYTSEQEYNNRMFIEERLWYQRFKEMAEQTCPEMLAYLDFSQRLYPSKMRKHENHYYWLVNNSLLLQKRCPEEAVVWAEKAVSLEPEVVEGRYMLGLVYVSLGKYSEAQQQLEPILAPLIQMLECGQTTAHGSYLKPAVCYVDTCTKLAQCYMKQGKYDKQKQIFTHLLNNPHIKLPEQQRAGICALLAKLEKSRPPAPVSKPALSSPTIGTAQQPLVSVIIPAYNAERYVAETIKSVLNQNYKNFELVVVNDGSIDQTKDIVLSFQDERIKYLYQENRGLASAHNVGIKNSKGNFLIKLDSDDMMTPDFIVRHLVEFRGHPEADLIYCDDYLIDENDKPIRVIERPEYTYRELLIRDLFRCGFPLVPFRTCIRRSVFDKIGLFDEGLLIGEDYDMMRRFVKQGLKAHHLKGALYLRRMHTDSLSRNFTDEKAKCFSGLLKRFTDTFSYNELFPNVAWNKIPPEMRQLHAKCLAAVTYLAIGQTYVKTNSPLYAKMAFGQASSELNDCLKMDPENQRIRQLLQRCEFGRQKYDEQIQQTVR